MWLPEQTDPARPYPASESVDAMSQLAVNVYAKPETISELTGRLLDFLEENQVDQRATHHFAMIVEEVLTNLGAHGNCREEPAKVTVTVEPSKIKGEIIDNGIAFDLRDAASPDFDLGAVDRPIGGLGLFLMHTYSCDLEYARRNGENWTSFAVARS
jgi:anti-sigma regulatory factor (Ser/Thr protein kinase)